MPPLPAFCLTPALYKDIQHFWLKDIFTLRGSDATPPSYIKNRFGSSKELDTECAKRYGDVLESIADVEASDLAATVTDAQSAVSLIILLDQMPRNIYRGPDACKAYTIFDPKAVELAARFVSPPLKYDEDACFHNVQFWQWAWIYMPFMHSEEKKYHGLFLERVQAQLDRASSETERANIKMNLDFGKQHFEVINRFGRYPSRNQCLGRQSTPEEIAFLQDGPGWGK